MKLTDALPRSLAFRIYFVGLAQFAIVAAGLFVLFESTRHSMGPLRDDARFVSETLARTLDDPDATIAELDRIHRELHATAVVFDAQGKVRVRGPESGGPECPPLRDGVSHAAGLFCSSSSIVLPDGSVGEVRLGFEGPPPPPAMLMRIVGIVLLVVGASSWLLSRSLTKPLRRLSATASALGGGDLFARVKLARRDELGDVARAFDIMADRVVELLKAEKELLANVSHELRTPLARIQVALDIAREGDPEVVREVLGDIASDLAELDRLIGDTLTAARLDLSSGPTSAAGIPPLRIERVDPAALLGRAVERFRAAHPERPLEVSIPVGLGSIDADEVLLRRAIDNLLENAHKYTERDDLPVVLRVGDEAAALVIEVTDRGIGIAASDLPNIFRPFFRVDRSRTRTTGGLGLGLALAKRIVEAHGGTLAISSELDDGTTACVSIPHASGHAAT